MLKLSVRLSVSLFLMLLFGNGARAQLLPGYTDTLSQRADWYGKLKAAPVLFAHIDKTVYVNNETIWFAAYLLSPGNSLTNHQVISVSLVNNNTQNVVAEAKFPMLGFAHGSLLIPDTIPPGNYSFVAISNLTFNGKPNLRFVQSLTIKTPVQPPFSVSLTLDTLYKSPLNTRILLTARDSKGPLDGAAINYFLGKDKNMRVTGQAKTNVLGSYTLLIPKDHINNAQHSLEVQVKSNKIVKTINLDIPVKKQINDVKFYPEGGYMVSALVGRVNWEAKTPGGTAIKATALLYADNKVVDTIQTDSYGLGHFYIRPLSNKTYTAKLLHVKNDDVVYQLPKVLPAGFTVHVADAIADDTLKMNFKSSFAGKFTMLVHNYRQIFASVDIDANKTGRNFKIALAGIPRGLNTITILDGLKRPLAEHLFFAHYNQKPGIGISVDDQQPGLRQKISLKLKLRPTGAKDAKALVSVAVVQDNRFEIKKSNNIEQYYYLQNELDNLPVKDNLMGTADADRNYLNDLLSVRGWTKYSWLDMLQTKAADTLKVYDNLFMGGTVTRYGDSLKKPVQLLVVKDSSAMILVSTTERGKFDLSNNDIFVRKSDNRIRMRESADPTAYTINISDPYLESHKSIAKAIEPALFDPPVTQDTKEFVFAALKPGRNLREVKIKGVSNKIIYGTNECGDYVCRFGILNCYNHPAELDNRVPQIGEMLREAGGAGLIKYAGCGSGGKVKPGMIVFKGIYNAKEYYGADYKLLDPLEPDYLSTVFWKHDVMLSADKEEVLSFYTSDITGKFRIVVQGVTQNDVVYGETSFEVQKKKTP